MSFLKNYGPLLTYGLIMAVLVFLLKWLQWKFFIADHAIDIYIGSVALLFTALGIWVATQFTAGKPKPVITESINEAELKKLNLSSREYEVLQLLAKGYSNADIADTLFLSLSTVKTHVSNLYVKMDVKSRTQSIEKAKRLRIIG